MPVPLPDMSEFRYQAVEANGANIAGVIEADDRKSALQLLGQRGLFPSKLELNGNTSHTTGAASAARPPAPGISFGQGIKGKHITGLTRGISVLLKAGISIPQALDSLSEEEEHPALKAVIMKTSDSVRKGVALSAALAEHPKLFDTLHCSMVRVGEEGGVLPKVMADLADLLEHEDDVRSEVKAAVAYPLFVLIFGICTVTILLTVVLPRLFTMLQDMLPVLPLPTLILLRISHGLHQRCLGRNLG